MIETKTASSAEAVRHVSRQGFVYYHPMFRETVRAGVRRVRALFPNYLFAQIDARSGDWRRLCSTRGVARVFLGSCGPARVSDDIVQYLRDREDDLGYVVPEHVIEHADPPVFAAGDRVRVRATTSNAIYVGDGSRRLARRVVYQWLGQEVEFEVSAFDLAPA